MKERQALADVTGPRYRKARKAEKSRILNEFCSNTGYNRKYAISVLRGAGKTQLNAIFFDFLQHIKKYPQQTET